MALALVALAASSTVPEWLQSRERLTACEAINYLSNVHAAQEQYRAMHGYYAGETELLDLAFVPPTHFDVGRIELGGDRRSTHSWSLTLTRYEAQSVYRPYSITCTEDGFDPIHSTFAGPLTGLRPRIAKQ